MKKNTNNENLFFISQLLKDVSQIGAYIYVFQPFKIHCRIHFIWSFLKLYLDFNDYTAAVLSHTNFFSNTELCWRK